MVQIIVRFGHFWFTSGNYDSVVLRLCSVVVQYRDLTLNLTPLGSMWDQDGSLGEGE